MVYLFIYEKYSQKYKIKTQNIKTNEKISHFMNKNYFFIQIF